MCSHISAGVSMLLQSAAVEDNYVSLRAVGPVSEKNKPKWYFGIVLFQSSTNGVNIPVCQMSCLVLKVNKGEGKWVYYLLGQFSFNIRFVCVCLFM